ncbi:MAG: hypothetical protein ABI678_18920, partial [Kofleriaceae bacterium]
MRSLFRTALLLLAACADEPDEGLKSSELVVNPTIGGPFGSLETCSSTPIIISANGEVTKGATSLMDNAAANWGHTNAPETFAAASTGSDGLGASKWYRGSGRTATKALLVYWNNATQCAYVVPNTATTCMGLQCEARSLDTSNHVYRKYAALELEDGVLGMPISNPIRFGGTSVTYQLFTNGVITYDAAYGAHYAGGPEPEALALARGWMRAFGVSTTAGPAAYPFMEDASCTSTRAALGNCTQDGGKNGRYAKVFDRAAQLPAYFLARTGWTESYPVWGNYAAEWMRIAGPQPWNTHGFPLADPRTTPTGEQYVPLEHG